MKRGVPHLSLYNPPVQMYAEAMEQVAHIAAMWWVPVMFDPGQPSAEAKGIVRRYIEVGPAWRRLPHRERYAVLLHEIHHHVRRDPLRRWLWLPLFFMKFVRSMTHNQEFAADEFVVTSGYGNDMVTMLRRYPGHDARVDPFHPTPSERIERIAKRLQEQMHAA